MTETSAWMSSLTESTTWVWCRRFLLMSTTTMNEVESHIFRWKIENTSWKVHEFVDVSEMKRVTFLIQKQEYKALSTWYCVYHMHTEKFIILAAFLLQIFPKC